MRFGNFTHTSLNRVLPWKRQRLSSRKRQSSPSGNIKSPRLVQTWFRQKVLLRKRPSTVWQSRGGTLFPFLTVVKTHLFSCLRDTNNAPKGVKPKRGQTGGWFPGVTFSAGSSTCADAAYAANRASRMKCTAP